MKFQVLTPSGTELPDYFTHLEPFHAAFETGLPILMYHKLRYPSFFARTKSIYLDPKLFEHHLSELSAAGFQSVSLNDELPIAGNPDRGVVITFDDGYANVFKKGLQLLEKFKFKAIQFLVARHIGGRNEWDIQHGELPEDLMDESQIREWLAAGHHIGAHTLTHISLPDLPEAQTREEIASSKKMLEDRFGISIEHFCYPYGKCDERTRNLVGEAGFLTACSTVPGLNTAKTDRLKLARISTRYRSRKLKDLWLLR
ncbi:MAG: polysaccharide deacetylase family protein [Methylacidiphilales bacterium]|nr:polysaccharide deacetylase family protein [Candidatus Methylacidiphilales bacterium]